MSEAPYEPQSPEAKALAASIAEQEAIDAARVQKVKDDARAALDKKQDRRDGRR